MAAPFWPWVGCSDPAPPGVVGIADTNNQSDSSGKLDVHQDTAGLLPDSSHDVQADDDVAIVPGGPGYPCFSSNECDSEHCVETADGKQCTETCIDNCSLAGWGCRQISNLGGDPISVCLPLFPNLCDPCAVHADCNLNEGDTSSFCLSREDGLGSFCGVDCSDDSCPSGYSCNDVTLGGIGVKRQCVPVSGACECSSRAIALNLATPCEAKNEFGVCTGDRQCRSDGLSACDAGTPAAEICGAFDDDCDGQTDEEDALGCVAYYRDLDGDLYGDTTMTHCQCGPSATYTSVEKGDCDDSVLLVNPGAKEQCDGIDNDCDGQTDEAGAIGCLTRFSDVDLDTWGDPKSELCLCADDGAHPALKGGDCDDTLTAVKPGAPEVCDTFDNDCDGAPDPLGSSGCISYFRDNDNDKFGVVGDTQCTCAPKSPYTAGASGDCDDGATLVNPSAVESCDGLDNNCDSQTDPSGSSGCSPYYRDGDGDKTGVTDDSQCLCAASGTYSTLASGDCNDQAPAVSPLATEVCNDLDDDCDSKTDEAGSTNCKDFYLDEDEDDYGVTGDSECLCESAGDYRTLTPGDCDDDDDEQSPGAKEACGNSVDDDCDNQTDEEGGTDCVPYYLDADGDKYGTVADVRCLCGPSGSFSTTQAGDCAGGDPTVYPTATETCNNTDDDCDNQVDEEGAALCLVYYEDVDKDGYGLAASSKCLCAPTAPFRALESGDCKDTNDEIWPGHTELCNSTDDNCNGVLDDEDAQGCETKYVDVDGDGFGVPGSGRCLCTGQGGPTSAKAGDCNDQDLLIYPGQPCGGTSCSGYLLTPAALCEGSGICTVPGAAPCPNGTVCGSTSACKTSCVTDEDCIASNFCVGTVCTGKRLDGSACIDDSQCQSDECNNGFCCGGGQCCGGQASQCEDGNLCTTDTCSPTYQCEHTNNTAECSAPFCDGNTHAAARTCQGGTCSAGGVETECTTTDPCHVAACSLTSATGCKENPGQAGIQCSPSTCAGSTLTSKKECNSAGNCSLGGSVSQCPGSFACDTAGVACRLSCNVDAHCRGGFYCDGGICLPLKPDGSNCGGDTECVANHCDHGICCGSGTCCRNAGDCDDQNLCTTEACSGNSICQSTPNNLLCAQGQCVASGDYLEPKYCADGSCKVGGKTALCATNNPCKLDTCNAATGGCGEKSTPIGTTCASPVCTGSTRKGPKVCDGNGGCALGGAEQPCPGGYICAADGESCASSCSGDSQCQPAFYCKAGICLSKKVDGSTCAGTAECISGNCNNATCCTTGKTCCQGDGDCDDGNACTVNACNGESWCTTSFESTGTQCTSGSCSVLVRTKPKTCDGSGNCTLGGTTENCDLGNPCRGYGCTPAQCTSTLSQNGTICAESTCTNYNFTPAKSCQSGSCNNQAGTVCVGGYVCNGATGTCATSCAGDAACQPGYFCSTSSTCQPRRDNGEACSKSSQCLSSHCDGGVCCSAGRCCTKSSDCSDGNLCTDDACNLSTFTCGNPNNTVECLQGFCFGLEHFAARSCSGAACASGGAYTDCNPTTPLLCHVYGCDPNGGCTSAAAASGVVCGAPTCTAGKLTASSTCTGAGSCSAPSPTTCAGGFGCDSGGTACRTSCTGSADCAATYYCAAPNCLPKKGNGATCGGDGECSSSHCANGHCCSSGACCAGDQDCNDNQPCTQDVCDVSFKCTAVNLSAKCGDPVCNGLMFTDTKFCSLGTGQCVNGGTQTNCGGSNECYVYSCKADSSGDPCLKTPRTGAPCGSGPTCSGYTLTSQSTCNTTGGCIVGAAIDCPNGLVCADATSCQSACTTNSDCRPGHFCDTGTKKCTVKLDNGGVCLNPGQCQSNYCNSGYCCTGNASNPTCCPDTAFCDDNNFCTTNVCNSDKQCISTNQPNTLQCIAATCLGNVPYYSSFCTGGSCPASTAGTACDPNNAGICQTLVCLDGSCQQQALTTGTPCSTTTCLTGNVTSSMTCNGNGTCVSGTSTTVPCPGGYACLSGSACRNTCTSDNHCQAGYICEGTKCRTPKSSGEACTTAAQCLSGNCIKGLCCAAGKECCSSEATCDGNAGKAPGERCVACVDSACTNKSTATLCRGAFCSGTSRVPDAFCSAGLCPAGTAASCAGANVCVSYGCANGVCTAPNAPSGTQCGTKRCQDGNKLVLAAGCNGLGGCVEPTATPCNKNLVCNDTGTDCRSTCTADAHCVGTYYCESNTCKLQKPRGEACTATNQCASGVCNNGYCCDGGTCCNNDSNCTAPNICSSATCSNSQCTYQVVTNKLCTGASCSATQVFTPEGRCSSGGACNQQGSTVNCAAASTTCSLSQCSTTAVGGCVVVPATQGTSCGTAACVDFELVPAKVCDGAGGCVANGTKTACPNNLKCKDAATCRTACVQHTECRSGFYCDLGTCSPLRPSGAPCSSGTACSSGYCESGLCCSSGECCLGVSDCSVVSCKDAACTDNTCTYGNNAAVCAQGQCTGAGALTFVAPKTCTAGSCPASSTQTNCAGANICKQYWCDPVDGCLSGNKPASTDCGPASCTGSTYKASSRCDGNGACLAGASSACTNGYTCNDTSTACRTTCTQASHCTADRICLGGACVAPLADGSSCTGGTQCLSGYCGNGICCASGGQCCTTNSQCGDSNACTDDACQAFLCTHSNNTKPCESARCEGDEYVAAKSCQSGTCSSGGGRTLCDLGLACMDYQCSQTQGCLATPSGQGLPCGASNCTSTIYTAPSVCDGFGNCASATPQQCNDNNVCTGAESCSTSTGCVAGNPSSVWVCGDGVCQTTCENAASCIGDCTVNPAYTLTVGEYDSFTTAAPLATNRIANYECNALSYPGAEYAYRITAPTTGTITVSLGGADSLTDLLILDNNSGDPGQCNTVASGTGSFKSFSVVAGTTYVLVVDRRAAGTTPFTIYARYTGQCKVRFLETWDRNSYPRAWTSEANWQTSQDSPFGATHAKFTGAPTLTSFSKTLVSPIYDISGCTTVNVKMKWRFTEDTTNPAALPHTGVTFKLESSTNGGTAWTQILTYGTGAGPTPPPYKTESIVVTIPGSAAQGRLRFTVSGDTSQYINRFQIEDIEVGGP